MNKRSAWLVEILAVNSVGFPSYILGEVTATEDEASALVRKILDYPRPALISIQGTYCLWLREGDGLVIRKQP